MTKVEQAAAIYKEVNGVRADFIKRVVEELGMGKAGASTYFQNEKKRSNGEKVVNYRPKGEKKTTVDTVDDSMEDAPLFDVEMADGTIKSFLSQQEAEDFKAANVTLLAA